MLAIRDENVVSVLTDMDQEKVAAWWPSTDLVAVTVVDTRHHLVGTITADDVVDIVARRRRRTSSASPARMRPS